MVTAHFDLLGEEDTRVPDIDWETRARKAWKILLHELYLLNEDPSAGIPISDKYRRDLVREVLGEGALEARTEEIRRRLGF